MEVLVKAIRAALNPIDWKIVDSYHTDIIPAYPFVAGQDGAGIVEQVGEEVVSVQPGDNM